LPLGVAEGRQACHRGQAVSGYRDDTESLKAEIERLLVERTSLDRRLGLGLYAATPFGRAGYRLGRRLARRLARRRPLGDASTEVLRARRDALERELARLERSLTKRAQGPDEPTPSTTDPLPRGAWAQRAGLLVPPPITPEPPPPEGWAQRAGSLLGRAFRRWRG
jgi:hypothetical protein